MRYVKSKQTFKCATKSSFLQKTSLCKFCGKVNSSTDSDKKVKLLKSTRQEQRNELKITKENSA